MLNRGMAFSRDTLLEDLRRIGIHEIISIESAQSSRSFSDMIARFPRVRFLFLAGGMNRGAQINIAMRETQAKWVYVIWNIAYPPSLATLPLADMKHDKALCLTPQIFDIKGNLLPTLHMPSSDRRRLILQPAEMKMGLTSTLFPYYYIGLYNRERFLRLGGYDDKIANEYWQRIEFGVRSWMWGAPIWATRQLSVRQLTEYPPNDESLDDSYARFYLKSFGLRIDRKKISIPASTALRAALFQSGSVLDGMRMVREIRVWANEHRQRFVREANRVTETWKIR